MRLGVVLGPCHEGYSSTDSWLCLDYENSFIRLLVKLRMLNISEILYAEQEYLCNSFGNRMH